MAARDWSGIDSFDVILVIDGRSHCGIFEWDLQCSHHLTTHCLLQWSTGGLEKYSDVQLLCVRFK